MALRFNPPPNWPPAGDGWVPTDDWQPDPSWGPAPDGWVYWVETPVAPAPAPPKKKRRVGLVIGLSVAAIAVVAGCVGVVTLVNILDAGPTVEGVERAGSIDEAKEVLSDTHDEAIEFLEENHGFEKTYLIEQLAQELDDGLAGTNIWEVEIHTSSILHEIEMMESAADLWQSTWEGEPAFTDNSSGTDLEAILDEYTNGTVDFAIDDACPMATACVQSSDPNIVHVTELYLDNPAYQDANYADVLLHEFGHVTQFKYDIELQASEEFETLFDSDKEFHADCMSLAIKPDFATAYGSVCSSEQLDAARDAWDGVYR